MAGNAKSMTVPEQDIEQAIRKIDPSWRLQKTQPLGGRACALLVSTGAAAQRRLILLTHSQRDRERNPQIARDEFHLLEILKEAGLPVPDALHLNETHQPPFLITSFAEGSSDFGDKPILAHCHALADILRSIHATDLGKFDLSFLPDFTNAIAEQQDARSPGQRQIQAAMRRALPRVEFNGQVLLHGDFWPGNLLWGDGALAAIFDWEDAMLGDPLADLGKSRLEILWALGFDAMNAYTARYLQLNRKLNADALPFWDLWGASRLSHFASFVPEPNQFPRMKSQYDAFVSTAICRLEALYEGQ